MITVTMFNGDNTACNIKLVHLDRFEVHSAKCGYSAVRALLSPMVSPVGLEAEWRVASWLAGLAMAPLCLFACCCPLVPGLEVTFSLPVNPSPSSFPPSLRRSQVRCRLVVEAGDLTASPVPFLLSPVLDLLSIW